MKKLFLTSSFILSFMMVHAQQCATHDVHQIHMANNAAYNAGFLQSESLAYTWRKQNSTEDGQRALLLTIPVVVHVLYKDSLQNISEAQIASQIDVLNRDYRALNNIDLPPYFDSLKADVEIEFCLASIDPLGNPTNGITRTSTVGGQLFGFFSPFGEDAKFDSLGGKNAWPTNQYLNLWVADLFPGLLGYAQFPGGIANTDGVVITTTAFGTVGNIDPLAPGGRTAVHEIGHWLGLRHIWGDDSDCTTGNDSIMDTPNANAASQQDCNVNLNSCANEDAFWGVFDPTDMVQNYMDYSNDTCMGMFTKGQKTRMLSFLYSDPGRNALFTSPAGCSYLAAENIPDIFLTVYPNPVTEKLNIKWNLSNAAMVKIMNVNGQVVASYDHLLSGEAMDVSALPTGIYFAVLSVEGGGVKTIKFMKQ